MKLNKILPICGMVAVAATPIAITSCSNKATLAYIGAAHSFEAESKTYDFNASEILYFRIKSLSRSVEDNVSFKILNNTNPNISIKADNFEWDNYTNGEFHCTLSWSCNFSKDRTYFKSDFDIRVSYIHESDLISCADTTFKEFSVAASYKGK